MPALVKNAMHQFKVQAFYDQTTIIGASFFLIYSSF